MRNPDAASRPQHLPPHPPLRDYYGQSGARQAFINELFNRTAGHYRSIEKATGFGSGQWYRRKALRDAGLAAGMKVLDVACGPGLVTESAVDIVGPSGWVVGLDPSVGMLHEARHAHCPHLVRAIGEHLPFADSSFDFLSMGYALRHVSDLKLAFHEYARVLKPGGVVLILEISRPRSTWLRVLSRLYIRGVLGKVFGMMTGNRDFQTLMQYWWDTTEQCVPPDAIVGALKETGFEDVSLHEMVSGLLRDYRAVRS